MSSGDVTHVWASSLQDILDHSFSVSKHEHMKVVGGTHVFVVNGIMNGGTLRMKECNTHCWWVAQNEN